MTTNFRPKFNFSGWRKMDRENLVFWGVVAVVFFTILLFLTEGLIIYQEFFGEKEKSPLAVIVQSLAGKELDEVLKIIDEREKEFNEVLQKP